MECKFKRKGGQKPTFLYLLVFFACDDLNGFKKFMEEEEVHAIIKESLWHGRRIGSKKMPFEERTLLMIVAMFGSRVC